jgi:endonuclease/exonuclease/phosphatase family metal-dependent hydrolase
MFRHLRFLRVLAIFPPVVTLIVLFSACGGTTPTAPGDGYLFCFWNMENFFDDQLDGRKSAPDREYDEWFARDRAALREKVENLSSALMKMNDGRGPDIIAGVELESERSAELLMDAMNAQIKDPEQQYKHILFKEIRGGRHIAPALITRLDVERNRTQLLGKNQQRILECHLTANGHDLVIVVSHWTSRVSDEEGEKRDRYGDAIFGRFHGMYKANPKVDFLVCGDFNDPPNEDSVTEHLRAIGDIKKVKAGGDPPFLYNLFADTKYIDGTMGSHNYKNKWMTFDQIAVSPGLLDNEGWTCETETARIINDLTADRRGHPHRFGNERDKGVRGWSDHFPVSVRLKVAGR